MLKAFILSLFIFVFFPNPSYCQDWGYSHNYFLQKPINKKWSIESRSLFSAKNNMRDLFFGTVDIGFSHKTTSWLSLGGAYRGAWFRPSGGEWGYENRPLINIAAKHNLRGYFLSNRSRFEFRFFEDTRKDDVRYRNETRIMLPVRFTRFQFQPYIEEEFFYSFNAEEVNLNWLTGGLMYRLNEHLKVKFGYRWQTQKLGGSWQERNVLVTGVMVQF